MSPLHATCEMDFTNASPVALIFGLRPQSGAAQWVSREVYCIEPRLPVLEHTGVFGNLCQRPVDAAIVTK